MSLALVWIISWNPQEILICRNTLPFPFCRWKCQNTERLYVNCTSLKHPLFAHRLSKFSVSPLEVKLGLKPWQSDFWSYALSHWATCPWNVPNPSESGWSKPFPELCLPVWNTLPGSAHDELFPSLQVSVAMFPPQRDLPAHQSKDGLPCL